MRTAVLMTAVVTLLTGNAVAYAGSNGVLDNVDAVPQEKCATGADSSIPSCMVLAPTTFLVFAFQGHAAVLVRAT